MKNIILYIVSFIFVANTFVVSASIKPCMHNDANDSTQIELMASSEMPCHSEQQDTHHEHCQDACFCLHFSINQIPVVDSSHFNHVITHHEKLSDYDQLPYSINTSPLYRPPILNS